MSVTDEQIAFVTDLFADVGPLTTRRMFGGLGIYARGTIFAVLMRDGTLMLKGAGAMADAFATAGWQRWTYPRADGGTTAMPYWILPETLLDDPETACQWARRALDDL